MANDMSEALAELNITNKLPQQLTKEDIINKHLPTVGHWEDFYYKYSQWMGFSVRKEDVCRDNENKEWQRKWVCSNQGFRREKWTNLKNRKKKPRAVTRTGCLALLRVNFDKSENSWVVKDFNPTHNHDLALKIDMQFLRSNRAVPDCMGAQVMSMRRSGIRTCHILNHLAAERGGHEYVPFLKKDLYNWIGRQRELEEEEETDAEGALGYLECLGLRDPNFFETHTIDGEYRLADLFWADGISRDDYGRFGEIIAFDTTYKKNAYNKPLLLFVGVNHHFRIVVFAVALLYDEKEDTYIWLLEEFLQCMNNKLPQVVVTDGDKAMAKAIEKVMPNAVHRLCAWHLQKNVTINVPHPIFKTRFNELLYQYCTEEEFDESWSGLVTEFQLQDSQWAAITYNNRRSWAECFLQGNFFAGLRTTQRSESMNSYLSHFLTSKLKLKDLVGQVDKAIQSIRHTEHEDDFISKNTSP